MDEKPQDMTESKKDETVEQPTQQADGYYGDDAGDEKELDLSFLNDKQS